VTGFLTALGNRLAETWLSLLVLPGLLFVTTAAAGGVLGHRHPFDPGRLARRIDALAAEPATHATGTVVLVAAGVLACSAGAGLLASALGGAVERLWLGDWPRPLARPARALTERRARRWEAAHRRYRRALADKARLRARADSDAPGAPDALDVSNLSDAPDTPDLSGAPDTPDATDLPSAPDAPGVRPPAGPALPDTAALNEARNRIALAPPTRPTWMGDRIAAVDRRVLRAYDLDLASAWPRLWLLLPEVQRADVQNSRAACTAAARRAGWGALYAVLALWWWPAAPIAATVWTAAWYQGRQAVAAFAELVEATVDLYGRELAAALGLDGEGRLTPETGLAITRALRKGT